MTYAIRTQQYADCDTWQCYTITKDGCRFQFGEGTAEQMERLAADLSKLTPETVRQLVENSCGKL